MYPKRNIVVMWREGKCIIGNKRKKKKSDLGPLELDPLPFLLTFKMNESVSLRWVAVALMKKAHLTPAKPTHYNAENAQ